MPSPAPGAAPTYQELTLLPGPLGDALRAFGQLLPEGGLLAYLVMMAPRLAELRRLSARSIPFDISAQNATLTL